MSSAAKKKIDPYYACLCGCGEYAGTGVEYMCVPVDGRNRPLRWDCADRSGVFSGGEVRLPKPEIRRTWAEALIALAEDEILEAIEEAECADLDDPHGAWAHWDYASLNLVRWIEVLDLARDVYRAAFRPAEQLALGFG